VDGWGWERICPTAAVCELVSETVKLC